MSECAGLSFYIEKKLKGGWMKYVWLKNSPFIEFWCQLMFILSASLEYFIFVVIYPSSISSFFC